MSTPTSRRRLLKICGLMIGLSGCVGGTNDPSPDTPSGTREDPSPTYTQPAELDPSRLAIEGRVLNQATEETPLTIESVISNEHQQEVQLVPNTGGAHALEDVPRMRNGGAELVLIPDPPHYVGTIEGLAEEPTNGCWQFVNENGEPATKTVIATTGPITMEPNGHYSVTHEVYQDTSADACFPEGTYTAEVSLACGKPDTDASFVMNRTYELEIGAEGEADFQITASEG